MMISWYGENFSAFWNLFFRSYRAALHTNDPATLADAQRLMSTFNITDAIDQSVLDVVVQNFWDHESAEWVIAEIIAAYTYCFPNKKHPPCSDATKIFLTKNYFIDGNWF